MDNEERRVRNADRVAYLENHIEALLNRDLPMFLNSVEARILQAVKDIYGGDSPAMRFLESVLKTGEPHPAVFNEAILYKGTCLIDPDEAEDLGQSLGYELLHLYKGEVEYYLENNLYGLWEHLEHAGMTHENIGRYFERFEEKNI